MRRASPTWVLVGAALPAAALRAAGFRFLLPPEVVPVGLVLAGLAVGLAIWSTATLARATDYPVTHGAYRLARHPMYLAMVAIVVAAALLLRDGPLLVGAGLAWFGLDRWVARPEERALLEAFPEAYAGYQARVNRWFTLKT